MDNTKEYKIVINGLTESINAVDSLNKQLDALKQKIDALSNKTVNVGAKASTSSSSGGKSTSEEAAVQREINKLKAEGEKLDAKIVAAQDEIYKKVDATKQLYKETVADQKAMAAEERLIANTYSNTMQGMKSHLADLKAAINVTDLGDSDKIAQMTKEANELTNKLKEMEQAYGTFGRNVGNYASAADGFKGLKIEVAGTTQEFDNAKQALKSLQGELRTLQVKKDQGMLLNEEELKRFQELPSVVAQLKSSIQDAGKPMDALMDTMQSIVAIAQSTKGLQAFLGLDGDKIERSIQKLVGLQNAMKGIETINKQIQSKEFLGGAFTKASSAIDAFAAKLTKTDKAAKGLALTLKGLTGIALIGVIIAITKALSDLNKKQKDVENTTEEGVKAYAKAESELSTLQTKLDNFNGTKKQEKKLVEELNSKYGSALGQYKSLAGWKDALRKKGSAYCQVLQKEAEMQAVLNLYTENYIKLQKAKKAQEEGNQDTVDLILKALDGEVKISRVLASIRDDLKAPLSDELNEYNNEIQKEIDGYKKYGKELLAKAKEIQTDIDKINEDNKLFDYSDQIDKNTNKTVDAIKKVESDITKAEIGAMKEGLNKKLKHLDEEERQTINKLKDNGRKSEEEIKKIQRAYTNLRIKEIQDYIKQLEDSLKESAQNIKNIEFDINTNKIENAINKLKNEADSLGKFNMSENTFDPMYSRRDLQARQKNEIKEYGFTTVLNIDDNQLEKSFNTQYKITADFYKHLTDLLVHYQSDVKFLTRQQIEEQEKQQREAEGNRYSIQMSGLTKTKEAIEDGIKAIQEKYGELQKEGSEEGAIVIKADDKIVDNYRDLQAQLQEIQVQIETSKKQHKQNLLLITEKSNNDIKKNEIDTENEISSTREKYYNLQISNYRDFLSKLNSEVNANPVVNNWGIVNIAETKKNYKEIINAAKTALKTIEEETKKVATDPLLTEEAKNATLRQLQDISDSINEGVAQTEDASKNLVADFVQSTQQYLQEVMNSFNTIMNAVWDAHDIAFDKEQEQLDKLNDELEEKLNKQKEIYEQHKNAVESIEDELANSRGDRRQHLIDQLNAEMEAQRAAAAEEKKLQKEKEANEKKQEELDKKRKKAEYDRQILQAIVNGAMAVTMAAINNWPIPAVPMMALAASTTAAQIAIMKANKPYASGGQLDGGVAVGNRHRDGGIKVLGGRAEIEGGEFITNRISTQMNAPLLEFINSKKKRIDVSDLLEFYSSGSIKKNISSVRTRFADGGYIPTLPDSLDVRDQLQNVIINQDNRPIYVSVVDINNKQADVRRVQTLAGLGE